jgi:hypothetical protein|nr:hypothetical protein [Candidatus Krumholzibacteria bacterium]
MFFALQLFSGLAAGIIVALGIWSWPDCASPSTTKGQGHVVGIRNSNGPRLSPGAVTFDELAAPYLIKVIIRVSENEGVRS